MKKILPRISVITPSFNQATFLERTICSVLDQGYPNLEYIIVDGGSTDGSIDIIKRYESRLAWWVSEADNGQAHAINKGLQRATGEWVAWQNSDDIYYPGSFVLVAKTIQQHPQSNLVIGDINLIDANGGLIRDICYVRPTYKSLITEGMVLTNQAAFWRTSLHKAIGWMDETLHYGFDYDWFLRLLATHTHCEHIPQILGALRYHADTKTSNSQAKFNLEYTEILKKHPGSTKIEKRFYQVRRLILMILNGKLSYAARGISNRTQICSKSQ